MGPNGSENFKMLLLQQIAAEIFHIFPEFFSHWSSQNYDWDFWNLEFAIFNVFFENFKFTIVAYGEIKNLNYLEN